MDALFDILATLYILTGKLIMGVFVLSVWSLCLLLIFVTVSSLYEDYRQARHEKKINRQLELYYYLNEENDDEKFAELAKRTEKLMSDNSPAILTAIGVAGSLTTAYLTGKASFKANEILAREERTYESKRAAGEDAQLEFRDKARIVWKLYIPAASTAAVTVTAIVCANRVGTRRAAAMAAAYTMSEKAFDEYKSKVIDKIGEKQEREVRDSIAQDHVTANPPSAGQIYVTGHGDVWFYDKMSGRNFKSSMDEVKKAQNYVNHALLNEGYASLNDLYSWIGLDNIPIGEEVGWNSDKLLEIHFSSVINEYDEPAIVIDFHTVPIRNFWKVR